MKFCMFHLMPYRDLPADFAEQHHSVWVDVPSSLFDPAKAHQMYEDSLSELEYAAEMGFDGVCVNEHHQNAYGLMPSPNIMAAALVNRTRDKAIAVLGNSVALYNPPVRVAEEFAMLDVLTGGRLIAGFPVGTSMDTNFTYGMNPATLRERYYEAVDLIMQAWTRPEVFSFDGRFTQLRYINIWPRPVQKPHPPVWVPGGGSVETWDWTLEHDYLYAYLSYGGYKRAYNNLQGYVRTAERKNIEPNPYRTAFLQLVVVGRSASEVEERYGPHVEYFYNKMLHVYPGFTDAPGYRTPETIRAGMAGQTGRFLGDGRFAQTFKDLVDGGNVVAGTPSQVTEQLEYVATSLNCAHLLLLTQIGSMPHDLTMDNIKLAATEVVPQLRHLFPNYEDTWWVQPIGSRQPVVA
ncbi:MAG: LLM class flavin-dependent oxidoreductase [Chloroflexi bacterium]|nr:LLM class flavin-dependent oxidoreductase [Chloroflexota bacterium]